MDMDLSQVSIMELVEELKKRFAVMDAMRAEVAHYLGAPPAAQSDTPRGRPKKGYVKMAEAKKEQWSPLGWVSELEAH
jgi:hypothetical protein